MHSTKTPTKYDFEDDSWHSTKMPMKYDFEDSW
jgi:hypothetical protein